MSDAPPPPPPERHETVHAERPGSGLAVGALVCGILALLLAIIPIIGIVGILLGLVALILGLVARSKAKKGQASGTGMAMGGIVTGILAVVVGILWLIGVAVIGSQFDPDFEQLESELQEQLDDN